MTRKRIRHVRIPKESRRNATFGRRASGFLKKANEFSILCGVDMGIIVHKHARGEENNAIMWPSPAIFRERLQKFLDFPNSERTKKMVTNEKFMEQMIATETDNLFKSTERVQLKESCHLVNQLVQGKPLGELDLDQLNSLSLYLDKMLEKLEKREAELNNEQQQSQSVPVPSGLPTLSKEPSTSDFGVGMMSPTTALLENLSNDPWFIESMSVEHSSFLGQMSNDK